MYVPVSSAMWIFLVFRGWTLVSKVGQQQQQRTTFSVILKVVGFRGHRGSISTQMGPVDDAGHAKLLISLYVDGAVIQYHITILRLSFAIREIYSDGL